MAEALSFDPTNTTLAGTRDEGTHTVFWIYDYAQQKEIFNKMLDDDDTFCQKVVPTHDGRTLFIAGNYVSLWRVSP